MNRQMSDRATCDQLCGMQILNQIFDQKHHHESCPLAHPKKQKLIGKCPHCGEKVQAEAP